MSGKEAPVGKWTDSLTIEMLPEQYQPLAEILGVQPLLKLAEQYGGASLYIPKVEALVKALRDKRIQKEDNGPEIRAERKLGAEYLQGQPAAGAAEPVLKGYFCKVLCTTALTI